MKKYLFFILLVFVTSIIISCRPSVVTDAKIEAKYSYTSDQDAISGILEDIYEIDQNFFDSSIPFFFFDEEKEIGEWLKIKFGSEIRKGEMIKIIYTYKGENNGLDILYRPYNKDVFPEKIISGYDFITILDITILGNYEPESSNNIKSSNNNSSSSNSTNRLANTKWQNQGNPWTSWEKEGGKANISFGQTSYSYQDNWGIFKPGSYTIDGDTINFTASDGYKSKGALIGNELTAFGNVFRRVE